MPTSKFKNYSKRLAGYSANCAQHSHRLCQGWRSTNDNGGGGARTRCHCPHHQAAQLVGYDPEPILIPLGWQVYFQARSDALMRASALLHLRPGQLRRWVRRERKLAPYELERIIACAELGLLEEK